MRPFAGRRNPSGQSGREFTRARLGTSYNDEPSAGQSEHDRTEFRPPIAEISPSSMFEIRTQKLSPAAGKLGDLYRPSTAAHRPAGDGFAADHVRLACLERNPILDRRLPPEDIPFRGTSGACKCLKEACKSKYSGSSHYAGGVVVKKSCVNLH